MDITVASGTFRCDDQFVEVKLGIDRAELKNEQPQRATSPLSSVSEVWGAVFQFEIGGHSTLAALADCSFSKDLGANVMVFEVAGDPVKYVVAAFSTKKSGSEQDTATPKWRFAQAIFYPVVDSMSGPMVERVFGLTEVIEELVG
jgi:hypothetical protein